MIIKRRYETIGDLIRRDPASREIFRKACEAKYKDLPSWEDRLEKWVVINQADLGSGIPGDQYQDLLASLDRLDQMKPYDNGLTYTDVTEIKYESSRKGHAVQLIMKSRKIERPERIVCIVALDDTPAIIPTWAPSTI